MTATNEPQLVQPEQAEKSKKELRPGWVTWVAFGFALFGLIGGLGGLSRLIQINQIDWASAALRADMTEGLFNAITILNIIFTLALSIIMVAAGQGMLAMKKWGALICIISSSLFVVTQLVSLFLNKSLDIASMIFIAIFALTGIGQALLWRKGKLT